MDFLAVITNSLANERTHMDYLLSTGTSTLPAIVRTADTDTRRYFLSVALDSETYHPSIPAALASTLSNGEDAPQTLETLSKWLDGNPGVVGTDLLIPVILNMDVPVEDRYAVVIRSLNSPAIPAEARYLLIEKAVPFFAFDSRMARSLLDALNLARGGNNRRTRSAFASLVSHSLDREVTADTFRSGIEVEPAARLAGALAASPILTADLAISCLAETGWDLDAVSTFLRETHNTNHYGRVTSGDLKTLTVQETRAINVIVREYILDPANGIGIKPRVVAAGYVLSDEACTGVDVDRVASVWREALDTVDRREDYLARKAIDSLTRTFVSRNAYSMYPAVYASATGNEQADKELRSGIIKKVSEITSESALTSADAVALWELVDGARTVSATPGAQDALIKSGRLPQDTLEQIAARRGRIGATAKAQIALSHSVSGDATNDAPADVPVELWDVHFGPATPFTEYSAAATGIGGLTPVGALGAYIADVRMPVESRTEARDLLVALANHNPAYASEVPDAAWGAMMRVQSPIELSHELTNVLMTLGENAQRIASKQMVNTVLL